VFPLDVTDELAVAECFASLAQQYGGVDICVHAAAYLSDQGTIATGPVGEFWRAFEVNVKGSFIIAQHFLRNARLHSSSSNSSEGESKSESERRPVLIGINSLIAHLPASIVEQCPASYASSKIALAKLYEYVASENPGVHCYSLHPGIVETEMAAKSDAMAPPQKDNPFLPRDEGK
jgi:NAD(P)-dependent dehydrogenase (short-subunit alcohol dehydrogenase family)